MLSKVLAGAVIDYMWAAEAMGLEDWAHVEMLRTFDAMTRDTATAYLEEPVKNAKRREIEMLDIVEMLEEADFAEAFAGPRPEMGDALGLDDDPFERYAGWMDA